MNLTATNDKLPRNRLSPGVRSCRACRGLLQGEELGDYAICAACGSANYVSTSSAEEDNVSYFDVVYSDSLRQPIDKRYRWFVTWERIHTSVHAKEQEVFQSVLDHMSKCIMAARSSAEVGFGSGKELVNWLRAGANIWGVDTSREAVASFQSKYPEFGGRVSCSRTIPSQVDVLYCNALFEHLDDPEAFLNDAFSCLNPEGALLMRLPLITARQDRSKDLWRDINFWKPCHRMLYSYRGLDILLRRQGFQIIETASLAYYGYKVMSTMLRHGFDDVARVRNPYFSIKHLDSDRRYLMILVESLFRKVICSDCAVIIRKLS